jgi:ribosome biogenesis GTPase
MVLEQIFLKTIGADARIRDRFRLQAAAGAELGRISFASHEQYRVLLETAECDAVPAGRLRWSDALPAVGDWVSARRVDAELTLIEAVLPRRTQFSRRAAGRAASEQVIAANIDLAVIVCGLDGDFNLRRIERYLVLSREGGAEPVIVLNKADICNSVSEAVDAVTRIANGTQVIVLSAREGVEALVEIVRDRTVAFLGSSGAGKSTIANGLLGEERQTIRDVRATDSRGRHTTTSRMLMALPGGGAIIDNPGMRELQLWSGEESLDETFGNISAFAQRCRFADCSHSGEPGCAVQEGLERGDIEIARWDSYRKLQKQLRHQLLEQDLAAKKKEKNRWKAIEKSLRKHPKYRR